MSDSFGRRPIYVLVLTIYLGANIGLALCPTSAFWLLLVLRMLQVRQLDEPTSLVSGMVWRKQLSSFLSSVPYLSASDS